MKLPHAWPRLWAYLKTALREGRVDDAAAGLSATAPADDPGQAPQQQARPPAALPPEVWPAAASLPETAVGVALTVPSGFTSIR